MGKRALTLNEVRAIKKPGRHAVGGGVVLQVREARPGEWSRSWLVRFRIGDKQREMGLGPADAVSLAEARAAAQEARKLLRQGVDPLVDREAKKAQKRAQRARAISFETFAVGYIEDHREGWKNAKHAAQWSSTLKTYAFPHIGTLPVGDVGTDDILKILQPIWTSKPQTASRVRMRLEAILDAAKAKKLREGENPAVWRGHLSAALPKPSKVKKPGHHAALPWAGVPAFMARLRAQEGTAARALEFAILTAGRTGEVLGARWSEIDLDAALWTVPPERMKAGKEHRVPLSDAAVAVLRKAAERRESDPVFAGRRAGKPMSNMAMLRTLRRMGRGDLTAHGFRSSFRDWCAEATSHPAEIAEAALAHAVGDKTVAAYQRGDLLERRRKLMSDWGGYCSDPPAGVVMPLRRGA